MCVHAEFPICPYQSKNLGNKNSKNGETQHQIYRQEKLKMYQKI